jgi:hypothetical protein
VRIFGSFFFKKIRNGRCVLEAAPAGGDRRPSQLIAVMVGALLMKMEASPLLRHAMRTGQLFGW